MRTTSVFFQLYAAQLAKQYADIKNSTTLVHIYFRELGIITYARNELYGPMDLIGKCSVPQFFFSVETQYKFVLRFGTRTNTNYSELETVVARLTNLVLI